MTTGQPPQPMKFVSAIIIWATLSSGMLTNKRIPIFAAPSRSVAAAIGDSQRASQTVILFLNWYKVHLQTISRITLVNQSPGKPYSVNLNNGERYLTYLRGSHLLTEAYLGEWRTYFKERDAGFQLSPQYEGPPIGFEYDLVMLNQEVDLQLASLKSLKIDKVTIVSNKATVELTLFGSYEFRLVRRNDRWMINEILNIGAE